MEIKPKYSLKTIITGVIVVAIFGVGIYCYFYPGVFVREARAIKAAEKMGLTDSIVLNKDVALLGFKGCSKEDTAAFDVKGKNSQGKEVTVTFCGSFWKGLTPRL